MDLSLFCSDNTIMGLERKRTHKYFDRIQKRLTKEEKTLLNQRK